MVQTQGKAHGSSDNTKELVGSGIPDKFTRVVTDGGRHLQSSGIWKLLLSRAYDNLDRANPRLEQAKIPDFVPLTLHHVEFTCLWR